MIHYQSVLWLNSFILYYYTLNVDYYPPMDILSGFLIGNSPGFDDKPGVFTKGRRKCAIIHHYFVCK